MILELKDICKDYLQGKMVIPVLKHIDFQMEQGEYVAIMGPSGSGKTTLMNIVGCLDQATSGQLFLDGQDISKCTENEMSDLRLKKIGFVFQNFQLLSRQTALENVELPLTYAGVAKKERRERALQALTRVGCTVILELKDICKDYLQGKMVIPVLKHIDFQMEQGEYVAIMGPSGSGKTTLMNIVGCLDQATSGQLFLDGQDISKCTENEMSDLRLKKIGFVFQNFQLLSRQTALENVELPLTYAGVAKKERRERALQALTRVGLEDRVNFQPNQLSGGQKQRVAIARALVNRPKILLADEPTGALDSTSGEQVMELFQSLNDEGVSVLMITHDSEIAAKAQRKVIIRDGIMKKEEQP